MAERVTSSLLPLVGQIIGFGSEVYIYIRYILGFAHCDDAVKYFGVTYVFM